MGKSSGSTPRRYTVRVVKDGRVITAAGYDGYGGRADAWRAILAALGIASLRGLRQVPSPLGRIIYAPGACDDSGASVETSFV